MAQSQHPGENVQSKIVPSEKVPGAMEKVAPLLPEDIPHPETIGSKRNETQDLLGRPITPEDAAEVTAALQAAGEDTGKGSVAARMQAAAAVNVREGITPPVGTGPPGTERGVVTGAAEKTRNKIHVQHGAKETA